MQTLRAICECCEDLLTNFDFDYVLTGKLHSDPLEARFGCYRQLNGANFFISLRQVLESEKKIRVLNTLKDFKNAVEDGVVTSLPSFLPAPSKTVSDLCESEFTWLTSVLHCNVDSVDDVSVKERNVIFYVSGYIGRSVSRANRCDSCKSMLLKNDCDLDIPASEEYEKIVRESEVLLSLEDRGGLSAPSEVNFSICILSYLLFQQLTSNKELFKKYLGCNQHEYAFVSSVTHIVKQHQSFHSFVNMSCHQNHKFFKKINTKLFHCYMKNLIKQFHPNSSNQATHTSQTRKVKKLSSKC